MVANAGEIRTDITADGAQWRREMLRAERDRERSIERQFARNARAYRQAEAQRESQARASIQRELARERGRAARLAGLVRQEEQRQARLSRNLATTWQAARAAATGAGIATAIAGKAVRDYAKHNDEVASAIRRVERAGSTVWRDLGRDLGGVASATAGVVERLGVMAERLREVRDETLFLGAFRDDNEAMREAEAQTRENRRAGAFAELALRDRLATAEATGDTVTVARIRGQLATREANQQIAALQAQGIDLTGEQVAQLRAGARTRADAGVANAERDIEARRAAARAERERAAREREEARRATDDRLRAAFGEAEAVRRRAAGDEFGAQRIEARTAFESAVAGFRGQDGAGQLEQVEREKLDARLAAIDKEAAAQKDLVAGEKDRIANTLALLRIDQTRRSGKEREAELERINLEYAQRRADIEGSGLSAADKAAALEDLESLRTREIGLAEAELAAGGESARVRTIAAGLGGSAGVRAQIFGPGRGGPRGGRGGRSRSASRDGEVTVTSSGGRSGSASNAAADAGDPMVALAKQAVSILTKLERKLPGAALAG